MSANEHDDGQADSGELGAPPMAGEISWHRHVLLGDIDAYLAQGWRPDGAQPTHGPHSMYAIMMDWPGPGEPPQKPEGVR